MDLRQKKTIRSIQRAFLELRAKKPLEKIRVRELAEQAEISTATFYLHYKDIYDLSGQMQRKLVEEIIAGLQLPADAILRDPVRFAHAILRACQEQQEKIAVLFSDSQFSNLPQIVETVILEGIRRSFSGKKMDSRIELLLSYHINGFFSVYQRWYDKIGMDQIIETLQEYCPMRYPEAREEKCE